ncbi:MAG: thermonuclease family protein [Acidimicrobiia bacterium]|nr:thermonuclease family protein [Acidimicrobiia bacterium]
MRRVASHPQHRPPRHNRLGPLVAATIVVAVAAMLAISQVRAARSSPTPLPPGMALVLDVIDGDTLALEVSGHRETIRMLGIDTPETHHPTRPVECFGAEASARLAELAPPGTVVRLERDDEARDHFGRLLAYVHLPTDDGDVFINHLLVAEGFAVALPIDPNRAHRSSLAAAERAARSAGAGLWGRCGGPGVAIDPLASGTPTASR